MCWSAIVQYFLFKKNNIAHYNKKFKTIKKIKRLLAKNKENNLFYVKKRELPTKKKLKKERNLFNEKYLVTYILNIW